MNTANLAANHIFSDRARWPLLNFTLTAPRAAFDYQISNNKNRY